MFWHPLFLAILLTDIVALFLLLAAALTSWRTVLYWDRESAGSRQLALESEVESASIQGRAAFWLVLFSALLLVSGIANVFHEDIRGAMCGTGVCQAMRGGGAKLILCNGLLLGVMLLWYELDKVNRKLADMPLTETNARLFLVIPPLSVLTLMQTWEAFSNIQPHRPVDCCSIVYDQFQSLTHASNIAGLGDPWWIGAFVALSLMLFGLGMTVCFSDASHPKRRLALAIVGWLWIPVAALTLVNILSAYHYEVLHHHCPWCLLLPEHSLVGYPLYGAMGIVGMETLTLFFLPRLTKQCPRAFSQALDRCLRGARHMIIAEIIFLIFSAGPAIFWWLRFGTWLTT
jgi:hypothetical protein